MTEQEKPESLDARRWAKALGAEIVDLGLPDGFIPVDPVSMEILRERVEKVRAETPETDLQKALRTSRETRKATKRRRK